MKKMLSSLLSIVILLGLVLAVGASEPAQGGMEIVLYLGNPMMTVNGVEEEIDPGRGTVPVLQDGRTLVPVRAIVEAMGGTVTWEESTQTATLTYADNEIRLTLGMYTAYLNDVAHTLDVAPVSINDRTMLPIRFVAEGFQFDVSWEEAQQCITITKAAEPQETPSATPVPEEQPDESDTAALVVYFSATGNTRALAEKVAEAAAADLAEIVPEEPYTSEDLNYNVADSRANQELDADARPAIEPMAENPEAYDVILLGYPIWFGECPPPVRTFLEEYALSGKTIMPFCTSGSTGISGSLALIRELCPQSTVTEGFRGTASTTNAQIEAWLTENDFSMAGRADAEEPSGITLQIGETVFTATLAENSSAEALRDLLAQGPLTIEMSDYGNFEKVGSLGTSLPRNDEEITTEPGDLILYQGNSFVIYYDTNTWNFTRLGKIQDVTQEELREVLGSGDVTVTLSLA